MSAKKPRPSKPTQGNLSKDTAALIKLVTTSAQKIKAGEPLVLVVTVVDTRNNGLAALMIKGPPPPPPLKLTLPSQASRSFAMMVKGQPNPPTAVA